MSAFIPCTPISPFPLSRASISPFRPFSTTHPLPARTALRRTHLAPVCRNDVPSDEPSREVPFEIRGFSLANVGLILGSVITLSSFSTYLSSSATASATSLGFVYGVPILLVGCALKYAELQPIPVSSSAPARDARRARATPVQSKIYSDITRHRYGDEAHLAPALAALGLVPRGEPCPELVAAEESVGEHGEYTISLTFFSKATPWKEWEGKTDRFERFFGPGVKASVEKVDAEKRLVALTLSSVVEDAGDVGRAAGVAAEGDREA